MANRFIKEQDYEQSQFAFWSEHFQSETCQDIVAQLSDAVYYSIHDQNCLPDCPDHCRSNMKRFDAFNGVYLEQDEQRLMAQGGFGRVYPGVWHGKEAAFKFVPVGKMTDNVYQEDMQSDMETNILEYTIQYESEGDSVLIPIGNYRQQTQQRNMENGRLIASNYNVYVYPKYDMNAYDLHKKHYNDFNDDIIYSIMDQCAKSLVTLAGHGHIHNDIKPQNFLVKFKGDKNDLSKLEVVLTDFGMAGNDAHGGSPVFASPECFSKKGPSSDMYSLGRVFLFLILPTQQFLKILYASICDDESKGSQSAKNICQS